MSDHRVARIVGDHVAASSLAAKTWHRVTIGELTTDEAADLLGCSDEERERARAIFSPVPPENQRAQHQALIDRLDRENAQLAAAQAPTKISVERTRDRTEAPRRMWWTVAALSATALSAVAAILLVLWPPSSTPSAPIPFVAGYRADPLVGLAIERGTTGQSGAVVYQPRSKLRVVLRPKDDVEQSVEVVGFARMPTGLVITLDLDPVVHPSGVIEIKSTAAELGLHAGHYTLVFAVGPDEQLPPSWEALDQAQGRGDVRGYETVWVNEEIHVEEQSTRVETSSAAATVEYSGCEEVWLEQQTRCVFDPKHELLLWIDATDPARVSPRVDGEPWAHDVQYVEGIPGFRLHVQLPVQAERLSLVFEDEEDTQWSLPVLARERATTKDPSTRTNTDVDRALAKAFNTVFSAKHPTALETLASIEPLAARYPRGRAEHATYYGVVLWWQGAFYDAAVSLREGVLFATKFDDPGLIGDSVPMYAAVLVELGYLDAALHWATLAGSCMPTDQQDLVCSDRAKLCSTLGWIHLLSAIQQGHQPTVARALLDEGLDLVTGTDCPDASVVPGLTLSLALADIYEGRAAAAHARIVAVDQREATPDERLRLRDADAQALLLRGDVDAASIAIKALAEAVRANDNSEGRWRLALRQGDLFGQQGRAEAAVEAYRKAEHESHRILELAAVGVGRETAALLHAQSTEGLVTQLVALGRPAEALCAMREAQARRIQAVYGMSDDPRAQSAREALAQVNADYAAARRAVDNELKDIAHSSRAEQKRLRAAADRSERALAEAADKILRQRSTWRPACEDLPPRRPNELLLGLYPLSRGWFVFVQDEQGTEARWIGGRLPHSLTDPPLGQSLLDPWSTRIEAANRIRVLASDRAHDLDVHLFKWNGAPLIEQVPVVYGAELPRATEAVDDPHRARRALLVEDPSESLRAPHAEVEAIRTALVPLGWQIDAPPPDEVNRTELREGLEQADLFYYAGHARHDDDRSQSQWLPPYAGGTRAWPAHLELAPQRHIYFSIQDILALDSAPAEVALMGCQTGVPSGAGGGMSLALAFLVAGADEVVATPERTADEVARAIGEGLIAAFSRERVSLAEGLRQAQRNMIQQGQTVGRYRVWVR